MFEFIQAGGWLMLPIMFCSVISLAVIVERLWSLRRARVLPTALIKDVWDWYQSDQLNPQQIEDIRGGSPLGQILAVGLANRSLGRDVMKDRLEEVGRQVVHRLERYLNTLGTIASITPLLGLLGTVIGMIKVFTAITTHGVGDPGVLAGGISEALITTAAGLAVAIPSLMFHRYFHGLVDEMVLRMEQEALRVIDIMYAESAPA